MIKGKLINITGIEKEHLSLIKKWRNDPIVYETLFEHELLTMSHQEYWYENLIKHNDKRVFMIQNKEELAIGTVGLYQIDWRSKNAEWGFYIGELDYRMGGYAAEAEYRILEYAFEYLNLHRIWCRTYSFNKKVLSLHERFSFKTEGVLRDAIYHNGNYEDIVIMSILKNEFIESKDKFLKLLEML